MFSKVLLYSWVLKSLDLANLRDEIITLEEGVYVTDSIFVDYSFMEIVVLVL